MKMKNFTQLPNSLISDPDISDCEFRTLAALMSFKYTDKPVFPSQATIAKLRNKRPRSILKHLKKLKEAGYIRYKRRGYSISNEYVFISEKIFTIDADNSGKNFTAIVNKSSLHTGIKLLTNNTEDNNTNNKNSDDKERQDRIMDKIRSSNPKLWPDYKSKYK